MLPSTARENNFPPAGLSRTYTTNSLVPDSAATAFSMYSGVKTNFYTMGYDSNIQVAGAKQCAYPACMCYCCSPCRGRGWNQSSCKDCPDHQLPLRT